MKTKVVSCHTAHSKPVKQEVNGTVILPPLVFPGFTDNWQQVRQACHPYNSSIFTLFQMRTALGVCGKTACSCQNFLMRFPILLLCRWCCWDAKSFDPKSIGLTPFSRHVSWPNQEFYHQLSGWEPSDVRSIDYFAKWRGIVADIIKLERSHPSSEFNLRVRLEPTQVAPLGVSS
jgi:hypothetical protein